MEKCCGDGIGTKAGTNESVFTESNRGTEGAEGEVRWMKCLMLGEEGEVDMGSELEARRLMGRGDDMIIMDEGCDLRRL